MRILRSVSRRGFNVGTAGWFTVLKPNTWFPASRLPRSSAGYGSQTARSYDQESRIVETEAIGRRSRPVRWLAIDQGVEARHRMRAASAIFGGIAITVVMLWWIMHP
ncbi:MAG: hypothetical protein JST28_21765 [Acidobacteria bacterium]|nr:hypothetical protein [Acidobacteriota bacterium]